jgi:hypothetical protein
MDLAAVIEEVIMANVETSEKRRRAATIVTDIDLGADAISDSIASKLKAEENCMILTTLIT